jgi:hypothetical protein
VAVAARAALAARSVRPVSRLGVDETRFWRKEPWLTGFVDLDTGDLLDVVAGRTSASVASWLNELSPEERAAITVVVTDPHAGYRSALLAGLAEVTAVVDRFHVAQLAGRAVTTGGAARPTRGGGPAAICCAAVTTSPLEAAPGSSPPAALTPAPPTSRASCSTCGPARSTSPTSTTPPATPPTPDDC